MVFEVMLFCVASVSGSPMLLVLLALLVPNIKEEAQLGYIWKKKRR